MNRRTFVKRGALWIAASSLGPRVALAAPIALVANTAAGSSNNTSVTTSAIDTTGANIIGVIVANNHAFIPTLTDSKSNTWTQDDTVATSLNGRLTIFHAESPTVGSGHTFTVSGNTDFPTICVAAFSNALLVSPFDQSNQNISAGSVVTLNTNSITPTQANELIVSGVNWDNGGTGTASIDSGMTITDQITHAGSHYGGALAYKVQTTAAAINPTWTITVSSQIAAAIASYKAAAAASGSSTAAAGVSFGGAAVN